MNNWLKWVLAGITALVVFVIGFGYTLLSMSLPQLDGTLSSSSVSQPVSMSRDALGHAVITADSRLDAAYALGYAHAQDRFVQMDLQRRVAAGELAEWLGKGVVNVDKRARFHQFRQRANAIYEQLPAEQQQLLVTYTAGVNDALSTYSVRPFEYLLTGMTMQAWQPQDSILVVFSMYMDLQSGQVARDLALTAIGNTYGQTMLNFLLQPSASQAALDGSILTGSPEIPELLTPTANITLLEEPLDIGSNNWAVSGNLTTGNGAMLANDMHLGLRVPIIWYRAQLNYADVQLTGVSLPGLPGIVVGTNGHIAWGFTNANLDNTDWVALTSEDKTWTETQSINVAGDVETFELTLSEYGPVQELDGKPYALNWVAHQPYAVNLAITNLDSIHTVEDAVKLAHHIRMPVQNMVTVDAQGNLAWTPAGAVTARSTPSNRAITSDHYDTAWQTPETNLPVVMNPSHGRVWSANARVIGVDDLPRYGDGGYANGARGLQIRDRLFDYEQFDEQRFYQIQLDNEARFLMPWHTLLSNLLTINTGTYQADIAALKNWQACACADSVGYTLVRRFRSAVINALFSGMSEEVARQGARFNPVLRHVEPGVWQLINAKPSNWLPQGYRDWEAFMLAQYDAAKQQLADEFGPSDDLTAYNWGKVNALAVRHPFAGQIPLIGSWLNQQVYPGFGDSYMPAVQAPSFGASQRLFVRPGALDKAILTLPGGQSQNPLSPYYRAGFKQYAEQQSTPLLPSSAVHTLTFTPAGASQ